jgi:hypothetical protein
MVVELHGDMVLAKIAYRSSFLLVSGKANGGKSWWTFSASVRTGGQTTFFGASTVEYGKSPEVMEMITFISETARAGSASRCPPWPPGQTGDC